MIGKLLLSLATLFGGEKAANKLSDKYSADAEYAAGVNRTAQYQVSNPFPTDPRFFRQGSDEYFAIGINDFHFFMDAYHRWKEKGANQKTLDLALGNALSRLGNLDHSQRFEDIAGRMDEILAEQTE